jgi:DNA-binding LacI/PurR family transcriptional regulator
MKTPKTSVRLETGLRADAQIEQQLRQQILSGKILPGEKLPPTPILAKEWRVSCTVIQKAMAKLAASGFIERRPRQGTFIKLPTEKAVIGVLFGPSLTDETAHFYRAMLQAIRGQIQQYNWFCRTYDGLTGGKGLPLPPDAEVNQHLVADLRNHAFKGLIEFSPGMRGLGEWERDISMPKVVFESPPAATDVEIDLTDFGTQSVAHLAARGCRNLMYIRASWHLSARSSDLAGVFDAAAKLQLPQPQVQSFLLTEQGSSLEQTLFQNIQLLCQQWQRGQIPKPDGLVVNTDIGMRAIALALIHSGVQVPKDLAVVCLANDGVDLHYGIPVVRYEFSVKEVADRMLELLWKRMAGEPLPALPVSIKGQIREPRAAIAFTPPQQ